MLGELEKKLHMTVKATVENTLLLAEIHVEDAIDLFDEASDKEIVLSLLREALEFLDAAKQIYQKEKEVK